MELSGFGARQLFLTRYIRYTRDMKEYKQFHTENNIFNTQTKVYFGHSDVHAVMHIHQLLLLTSQIAVEDYDVRGIGFEVLQQNDIGLLLSRLSCKIDRLPKDNEEITVRTWEEPPKGLQLSRRFEITSTVTGEHLLGMDSLWLIVQPESRRILKPSQFTLRPTPTYSEPFDGTAPSKFSIPEDTQLLAERTIYLSDLDANGHTNNSRYAAFALDHVPPEYQNKAFTGFRINYSKEAKLGDTIKIFGAFDDQQQKFWISARHESGETCFDAEFTW